LVANNAERIQELIANYQLRADANDKALLRPSKQEQTFVSQRRALADLLRLQIYGANWASTGIDQVYPEDYERAQTDLDDEVEYHGMTDPSMLQDALAMDVLDALMSMNVQTILVNEPMLISDGQNGDVRYNFFYPRWAYDEYRTIVQAYADEHDKQYLDLWDLVPADEFTNSAIHLTPHGESLLANEVAEKIQTICK